MSDAAASLLPPVNLRRVLLDPDDLRVRQARADRLLAARGAGHLVHDLPVRADGRLAAIESRPWRLDPIPVVLEAVTFDWLAAAVADRLEGLEAVVADLYGERRLVRDRVVPPEVLAGTPAYRLGAVGRRPRRWLSTYAVDVALGADGVWSVVQDLTNAPPGLGYALLDRSVMSRVWPELTARAGVAAVNRFVGPVRDALAAAAPADSPRIVLFSGGLDHPSYVDHSFLAVQLGMNLVEGSDLVVRRRRVWLRTLDGLEPVDVLYRRLEDDMVDPLDTAASGNLGVPGLLQSVRADGVALANAHGSGVIESALLRDHLDAAIAHLHQADTTLLLGRGTDIVEAPLAAPSLSPEIDRARVVIRLFAVHDGQRAVVFPGGTGRVLAPGDDPRRPTACTAKDVWVVQPTSSPQVALRRLPQVDFGRSVPTRAADALYWMSRAGERAEAMARAMRVITSRAEQDPGLVGLHGGAWTERMCRMAAGVRRHRSGPLLPPDTTFDREALREELATVGDAVAAEIGALLTEATTVREFLSVTTGRVLAHLAELRSSLQLHLAIVDDLDAVLADFAALAGLWQESTVRGPAWRIGDTGRRLERCLVLLDLLEAGLDRMAVGADGADELDAATIEVILAASDSLVAYRRRHRSDVELGAALRLLVTDRSNPRSIAASIDRLELHGLDGEEAVGDEFIASARAAIDLPVAEMIPTLRALVDAAGAAVVSRWFSTPVNPIIMHQRGVE